MSEYTPKTEDVREAYPHGDVLPPFYDPDHEPELRARLAEFDRWLAQVKADAAAQALEEAAESAESMADWTENNFLRGPNTDYAVRHNREMAEELRERAANYRKGQTDAD